MAKYGFTLYGISKYGEAAATQIYYKSTVVATPLNYGYVNVAWSRIQANPDDPAPTHWRLIRSTSGIPIDAEDGILLTGGAYSSFDVEYDDFTAQAGAEATYSLWVFNGTEWIFCGAATAVVVSSFNTLRLIARRLPGAWVNEKYGVGDATGEPEADNTLINFLDGFVFNYDMQRTQAGLVADISNYRRIPRKLLPVALQSVGMPYEPALGDYTHRSLYRVGHIVNGYKGTIKGIRAYTAALTHWGNTIYKGVNLMLDHNDSSFEESVGRWATTNGTLARTVYAASVDAPTGIEDPLFAAKRIAYARLTKDTSSVTTLSLGATNPKNLGIAVKAGNKYRFSAFIKHVTTSGTAQLNVLWYDRVGAYLSTTTQTAVATSSSWQRHINTTAITAPTNAEYATLEIKITGAAGAQFDLDMLQFSLFSDGFIYEDARLVKLEVESDRINYLPNPGFDAGTSGWSAKTGSLISYASATSVFGARVGRLTASGSGAAIISEWVPVQAGSPLCFSAFVKASATRNAIARIEFTTPQSATDQTSILQDANGQYFTTSMEVVDGTTTSVGTTNTRVSVYAQSPSYVADNGPAMAKVSLYFPNSVANDTFDVDCCLLENATEPREYFQGNGGPAPTDAVNDLFIDTNNCRWEVAAQTNLISNATFDTTTSWTANSGTTITSVATTGGVTPVAGSNMLRVVRTTAGSATVTTTVNLEDSRLGLDYALSIYVNSFTGTVAIGDGTNSQTFTIPANNGWTRISAVHTSTASSFTFTFTATTTGAATFYLDAPQVEYGRIARAFVDVANRAVTRANTANSSANVAEVIQSQFSGGRSFFWSQYFAKYERLKGTLDQVMPLGADWMIVSGEPSKPAQDMEASIIKSASFETSLDGWTANNASLAREVSRGSHYSEFGANGSSWCKVTASGSGAFGLTADAVPVLANAGYYLAVAIKPGTATGNFTVSIDWKNSSGTVLWTTSSTTSITSTSRWAYVGLTDKNLRVISSTAVNATTATVKISAANGGAGKTFSVDRVLFRQ